MKHSYIVYAAVSEDGESIFQHEHSRDDDTGEHLEWFDEWGFCPSIVPDCGYIYKDILARDLKENNCPAKIKKYKITVEELSDEG